MKDKGRTKTDKDRMKIYNYYKEINNSKLSKQLNIINILMSLRV